MTYLGFRGPGVINLRPDPRTLADYGWFQSPHTDYWYKISQDALGFNTLRASTQLLGADAASVLSAEENAFIVSQYEAVSGGFYIGGSDDGSEGTWYWVNGDTWSYENWAPGQPDDSGGDDNYLSMVLTVQPGFPVAGQWNDLEVDVFGAMLMQIKDESALTEANWLAIIAEAGG